jgi:hypothetical protein
MDATRIREPAHIPPWDEPAPDLYAAIQLVRVYLGMITPEQVAAEEAARLAAPAAAEGEDPLRSVTQGGIGNNPEIGLPSEPQP